MGSILCTRRENTEEVGAWVKETWIKKLIRNRMKPISEIINGLQRTKDSNYIEWRRLWASSDRT